MRLRATWHALIVLVATAIACDDRPTLREERPPEVRVAPTATIQNGQLALPNERTSIKFAVIGDSGRGSVEQHEVAQQMRRFREAFKYDFVIMLGDNIYEGPATPEDYRLKFEEPYRELLERQRPVLRGVGKPR